MTRKFKLRDLPGLIKLTYKQWNANDPWRLSAVIAYYAVISIPALLVVVINLVGAIWGVELVTGQVIDEIAEALGTEAAVWLRETIIQTQGSGKSTIASIIGVGTLLFGATGVFYHLKISMNTIWGIKLTEDIPWYSLLIDRLVSFGFVLVLGFLLLISFLLTTVLAVFSTFLKSFLPELVVYLAYLLDFLVSYGAIAVLFALIFKYLPDAKVQWKSVWIGAFLTSFLFVIAKFLMGFYFSAAEPGSTYGAAGSMVLVLLWVSYSCLIFFFGAEFTKVYSVKYGYGIIPKDKYSKVKHKEIIIKNE